MHQGRTLLHWHAKVKQWMPPGGHLDPNEDPVAGALREVREETGLNVELLSSSASYDFDEPAQLLPPVTILVEDVEDEDGLVLLEFFKTYDAHRDAILAYFDDRKTSGPVEGLNNKARVITKRCYGVKNTKTLWNRLCLDVNLAAQAARFTVQDIRALANRIRGVFLAYYT